MQCDQREGWMGRSESKDLFKKIGLKKNDRRQSSENIAGVFFILIFFKIIFYINIFSVL